MVLQLYTETKQFWYFLSHLLQRIFNLTFEKTFVTTENDLTYERLPEYYCLMDALTTQKRLSVERANKITAISETKADFLIYL